MSGRFNHVASIVENPVKRLLLWGVVLVALQTGCMQSDTQPESTGNNGGTGFPTLAALKSAAGLSDAQTTALTPAYRQWQQAETVWGAADLQGEPPAVDFIASAAAICDAGQLGRLVQALHGFEAGRAPDLGLDDRLFGPGDGGGMPGHHGPGGPHHPRPGDPFRDLGLTAEQMAQVRQAQQDLHTAIEALVVQLRDGTLTPEQFQTQVEAARGNFESALQTILTPEQYAQLQAQRRQKMIAQLQLRLARFDTEVTRRVAALDIILDLSDAQVAEIQPILANTKAPIQAVLAGLQDASLTPQAAAATLAQIERDATDAVRATLTAEQATIFDRLITLRRLFPGCHP
jgi:hypothetical protein